MRTWRTAVAAAAALSLGLTACGGDDTATDTAGAGGGDAAGETPTVGVILPDSASSDRWETADRPLLEDAFEELGVEYDIQNANGDVNRFQTIADQMITSGVDSLMITNLDSGSGAAVIEKARSAGVPVVDYDRLTLGGEASYYVSFDNEAVGRLQGEGLVQCLQDMGKTEGNVVYLNGSPTDNNATLFKNGYSSVIEESPYTVVADQSVPDWDNQQAATIFEQMLTANPNVDGVLAANDGLGNAAISILERNNANGQVPVTGQDATVEGLQNILAGDQCMTVYKAISKEAKAAAELAAALAQGEQPEAEGTVDNEGTETPAVLLEPQAIFKDNVADVVEDGFVSAEELCTGEFADECSAAGIS
jgi:D-xylose transport system substrate-binding protein